MPACSLPLQRGAGTCSPGEQEHPNKTDTRGVVALPGARGWLPGRFFSEQTPKRRGQPGGSAEKNQGSLIQGKSSNGKKNPSIILL